MSYNSSQLPNCSILPGPARNQRDFSMVIIIVYGWESTMERRHAECMTVLGNLLEVPLSFTLFLMFLNWITMRSMVTKSLRVKFQSCHVSTLAPLLLSILNLEQVIPAEIFTCSMSGLLLEVWESLWNPQNNYLKWIKKNTYYYKGNESSSPPIL